MEEEKFEYVVFIDIDGVLLTNFSQGNSTATFETEAVRFINELYKKYNIKLVLSSSWRHAWTFVYMQQLFRTNNIEAPLIDRTYIITSSNENRENTVSLNELITSDTSNTYTGIGTRDNEIKEWIRMFKPKHYLILDDYKMNDKELESHRISRLSAFARDGFVNMKDFKMACNILNK